MTKAKTVAERVASYRQRKSQVGLVKLELYAHPDDHTALKSLCQQLEAKRLGKPQEQAIEVRITQEPGQVADLAYSPAFEALPAGARYAFLEDAVTLLKGGMSWIEPTIGDGE